MNKQVVASWFEIYKTTLNELCLADLLAHVWNTDETGVPDHFVSDRVISEKGKPCYEINASERGQTTTTVATFDAVRNYLPPMVIMKGKRISLSGLLELQEELLFVYPRTVGPQVNCFLNGENVHEKPAENDS